MSLPRIYNIPLGKDFIPEPIPITHPNKEEIKLSGGVYKDMVSLTSENTGGSPSQIKDVLNKISWHETGMTNDPMQVQGGGGPGRGLYQFEPDSMPVAIQRSINFYKEMGKETPTWLTELKDEKVTDATTLPVDQQSALALGNIMAQKGSTKTMTNVFKGDEKVENVWAKYHWAGKEEDKETRIKSFKTHEELYKPETDNTKTEIITMANNTKRQLFKNKKKNY